MRASSLSTDKCEMREQKGSEKFRNFQKKASAGRGTAVRPRLTGRLRKAIVYSNLGGERARISFSNAP